MTAMSQKPQSDNTAGGVCRAVDDAELDALVMALTEQCAREHTYDSLHDEAADAITTLRAQLADANARADRAEAERAAQIEVDAGICDEMHGSIWEYDTYECALSIRAQPRDRTALDAAIRAAKVEAWKKAADELKGQGYNTAVRQILALIEREGV